MFSTIHKSELPFIGAPVTLATATVIDSSEALHKEFVKLGSARLKLKNRMLMILPEIYKRGIYKKYAGSIVEYAGKYGDIARTTVIKRLRLEENLANKPFLKAAIENVGVHKVAMLATVATKENEEFLANRIATMSKEGVQTLSKEIRAGERVVVEEHGQMKIEMMTGDTQTDGIGTGNEQIEIEPKFIEFRPCKAVPRRAKIEFDEEATFLLMKLKAKLGKNISDKAFLKMILQDRVDVEFSRKDRRKKTATGLAEKVTAGSVEAKKSHSKSITGDAFDTGQKTTSRYVKVDQQRAATDKTGGKCSYPNCNNPYQVLHHIDRFSESKNHYSITPFCKVHHEFAHNNLIANEAQPNDKWRMSLDKPAIEKVSKADVLYRKYRQRANHFRQV